MPAIFFLVLVGADGGDDELVTRCSGKGNRLGGEVDELQGPLRQAFNGKVSTQVRSDQIMS